MTLYMLQLQSPSIPGTYSTKIWMSTELAENQDLGPLGYPHHRGVLGFWRIFYTNLKIAIGLREKHTWEYQFRLLPLLHFVFNTCTG